MGASRDGRRPVDLSAPLWRLDLEVSRHRYRDEGRLAFAYYPAVRATLLARLARWCFLHGLRPLAHSIVLVNDLTSGIWVGPEVEIGKGALMVHPRGLVVEPGVQIGDFCTLAQHVVLAGPRTTLGNFVDVSAAARVVSTRRRPVRVGDFAVLAAGSVVTRDVEPFAIVAGAPARTIRTLTLEQWLAAHPWFEPFVRSYPPSHPGPATR